MAFFRNNKSHWSWKKPKITNLASKSQTGNTASECTIVLNEYASFSKSLDPRNIEKSVSDNLIRFPFESSFWISVSGLNWLSCGISNRQTGLWSSLVATSGVRIWKFCNRIGSEIFSWTPYPTVSENFKLWAPISKSETAHSVAHEPKYLVVSIVPHGAKVLVIFPLVRQNWLKWSCDKYDMQKKTLVRV